MTTFRLKVYILFQSKLDCNLIEIIELCVSKNECTPKLIVWSGGFVVTLNSTDASFSPIRTILLTNATRHEFLDIVMCHRFKSRTAVASWKVFGLCANPKIMQRFLHALLILASSSRKGFQPWVAADSAFC